jgi:hypothetical protein
MKLSRACAVTALQ